MNKQIPLPNTRHIKGLSHRAVAGEFLNPDVRRGRKDGKHAPDAWRVALNAIDAEETRIKDETRSMIRQTQAEAGSRLEHISNGLEQNRVMQEALKNEGRLLPEPVAATQYKAARRDLLIAGLLTILDVAGSVYITKKIFGGNILLIFPVGVLLPAGVIFGVKTLLDHLRPEN